MKGLDNEISKLPDKHSKLILYKISKVSSLIKKIKKLTQRQGLEQNEVIEEICTAFHNGNPSGSIFKLITSDELDMNQYFKQRLLLEGNKLAVSVLQSLYRLYTQLKQKLASKQIHIQKNGQYLEKQPKLKLQQIQPLKQEFKAITISKQVKIEQQVLQSQKTIFQQNNLYIQQQKVNLSKQNYSQKRIQKNKKYLIQKLNKLKKLYLDYLKSKSKKSKQEEQQCNRKFGPKVQMQKYNPQEWQQVKLLRQKLLGSQQNKIKNKKRKKYTPWNQIQPNSNLCNPSIPYVQSQRQLRQRQISS